TYIHSRSVPYSIYIKYNPNTPQIETGEAIILGSNQINSINLKDYGFKRDIIVTEAINEELYLNDKKIQYVLNDYDFFDEFNYSIFHTPHLEEVTAILDAAGVSYSLPATRYYNSIDTESKNIIYTVLLSVMIVLLIFSLFFILVDASNYINNQIKDIIILRNIGISKKTVINTYAGKLYLKLLSSFILGFIFSIFATYHLKSFSYTTNFFFLVNPITLLLCLIIGAAIICLIIYLYLLKRFRFSAAVLKIKNKI
ncbi:MAG: hypothetical protein K2I42_06285, partial [Anaeroplasmataceae bacterium]|nr:hypothetical protein [Anaeroplasmataceae bacterium]